ncbi:hypothetical protein ABBQ38_014314 [Trebouxia sp. C0009 RCD-2024]
MAFYVKMSTAPGECAREALRQGLGVSAAVAIGYTVVNHDHNLPPTVAKAWLQSWKWAAITVAVVTSPVIGKVAKVSFERFLGTIAGGILAYGAARFGRDVIPLRDEIVCTIATLLAASGAQLVGQRAGSAYAAKLSTITFLLVLLGSKDTTNAVEVMVSRICGILGGVLISLFLSVLVFPTSASLKATDALSEALKALTTMSSMAWGHEGQDGTPNGRAEDQNGYHALPDEEDEERGKRSIPSQGETDAYREEVLHDVYSRVSKCQDNLPLALNEVYVCTLRGGWYFLPAFPGLRSRSRVFPNDEMDQFATSVRQVARTLWTVHVTLQMGFEEEVLNLLRRHYPAHIMPDLQHYSQEAMRDLSHAFPTNPNLKRDNLDRFVETVGELTRIASERRSTKQRLLNSLTASQRGEYTNLGQEADESQGQSPVRDKQQEDNDNPDVASRGDTHQLEAATRGGLEDQPSLAFFPADKTGYIAKVRWYSFQFSMQQLAEELKEAFAAGSNVLTALPARSVHQR